MKRRRYFRTLLWLSLLMVIAVNFVIMFSPFSASATLSGAFVIKRGSNIDFAISPDDGFTWIRGPLAIGFEPGEYYESFLTSDYQLYVRGSAKINGSLSVVKDFYVRGSAKINGSLSVVKDFFLGGLLNVHQKATFFEDSLFEKDVDIMGNLFVKSDLTVDSKVNVGKLGFKSGSITISKLLKVEECAPAYPDGDAKWARAGCSEQGFVLAGGCVVVDDWDEDEFPTYFCTETESGHGIGEDKSNPDTCKKTSYLTAHSIWCGGVDHGLGDYDHKICAWALCYEP